MEEKSITLKEHNSEELTGFDYENTNLPRDFDIRIEVAEQREVIEDQ
jgi:hypothetical protein